MMKRFNLLRRFGPKCGARTKWDGHPCQNHAMANGRCFRHGGRTPSGDAWHQTAWPDPASPNAEAKLHRKLRDSERRAKKRAARLAKMTPEERAAHEAWHRARKPGSAAQRAAAKRERQDAEAFREAIEAPPPPLSPERAMLRRRIEELQAKLAEIRKHEDLFE
ncbi:hypothetical protein [Xanthobacter autotrophicus]|uniref:hypothetical protein n=1 Tax=Xanthobacter autotrophicus TaxID=280 RepID=UPI00372B80CA